MADPRVFYDPKTKKIVRTDPPGLMKLIQPVEGTSLVVMPACLFDLEKGLQPVSVQRGVEVRRHRRKQ